MGNLLDRKITYNNYEVLSAKKVDMIIFVKTVNKNNGQIFWFIGFATKFDFIEDIKRILNTDNKYPNRYFKEMFKDDRIDIVDIPIMFKDIKFESRRKEIW